MSWKPIVLITLGVVVGAGSVPPRSDQPSTPEPASATAVLDTADPVSAQIATTLLDWEQRSRTSPALAGATGTERAAGESWVDIQHALQPGQLRSPVDHLAEERW